MQISNNSVSSIKTDSNSESIIQQFEDLWLAIQNAKSGQPQKAAEQNLEKFLSNPANYEEVLDAMNTVGFAPYCYAKDPQVDLHALFLALQTGNIFDIDEQGNNVNTWMGMTLSGTPGHYKAVPITAQTILETFFEIEAAYEKMPNFKNNQEMLAWILNSKYAQVLSQLTHDPSQCLADISKLQADLKNGDSTQVKADLSQLIALFNLPG